jgi:hypothetical protein
LNIFRRIANAARAAVRSFDAAGGAGRWPSEAAIWARTRQELAARPILAMRAGYLVENSPSAGSIEDQWADNLIGDGPSVRSGHPNETTRRTLEGAWLRFSADADIEGGDLTEFLKRTVRTIVTTGDGFVRLMDGGLIVVEPAFVVVPPEMETATQKTLTAIQPVVIDNVNVFSRLSLIVEPRLKDTTRWYVVADPATIDGLEYTANLHPSRLRNRRCRDKGSSRLWRGICRVAWMVLKQG